MKPIRTLHLSTTDIHGGAGIAAMAIHAALMKNGIDSSALVMSKRGSAPNVSQISFSHLHFLLLNRTIRILFFLFGHPDKTSSFNLFGLIRFRDIQKDSPHILHLHYIGCQFVGFLTLFRWKGPIVWNIHDFWPLSGVEHLPRLRTPGLRYLLSPLNHISKLLKKSFWDNPLHVAVFPSQWALQQGNSLLKLPANQSYVIPNIVDIQLFSIKSPPNSLSDRPIRIGLFYPDTAIWFVKGMDIAEKAFRLLPTATRSKLEIHFFGTDTGQDAFEGIPCINHGILPHESMAQFYHAIDICLVPSRQETFGLITAESICCGTPVITMSCQGAAELVDEGTSGWICKSLHPFDLASTLQTAIANIPTSPEIVAHNLRRRLDPCVIASAYTDLYNKLRDYEINGIQ